METKELITTLEKAGLLERLNEETKDAGFSNLDLLIAEQEFQSFNALGAIYPLLNREERDKVIRKHLGLFDGIRYDVVNRDYTPQIREPLLLADITLARRLSWPGLHDEEKIWKGKEGFSEIEKEVMAENGLFNSEKVHSDFLVAYALMRKDFTPFGEDYIKAANPEFLNRVKGIVALRFGLPNSNVEQGKARLYELLPKSIHNRIEPLMKEGNWADYHKFN